MQNILKNDYIKIFGIIFFSFLVDNLFISGIHNPPAWDQGYHLSNVFKMYNILDNNNINLLNKINQLIEVTDSYRGPLTYLISALFLKLSNNSYYYAYLSNQIFNIICIFSIYEISKIFKNNVTGIWASLIFSFSSLIVLQRSDYLIDLSLTSFSTLGFLSFTKWYLDNKKINHAILSGITLALIFLIKPTGIVIFLLPFLAIVVKISTSKESFFYKTSQIFLFLFTFIVIIFPWFSRNWLTILTSIMNAWNWGVSYQEGFKIGSLESWFFFYKSLPNILGILPFSIISIVFLIEKSFQKGFIKINFKKQKKLNLWFLIYFLNSYLIVSLMSTKDIRFILPIYPILCIYFSSFINSTIYKYFNERDKKIILLIAISISLFTSNDQIFRNNMKLIKYKWPQYEIMKTIKDKNPNLTTTLAILPDTKEINTFNLEAEAARQGEYVAARQVVSNKSSYKNDLKYFDWFLLKTGDQGVMSNESKDLLNQYLLGNSSFTIENEWTLPDKSSVILLRRKNLNSYLNKKVCSQKSPLIDIKQSINGINISFSGKGKLINSSQLLIDFDGQDFKKTTNLRLANGFFHNSFDQESCYSLSQEIPLDFPQGVSKNLFIRVKLLSKNRIENLENLDKNFNLGDKYIEEEYIKMANRISKVEELGVFLREGKFKDLFDLVGILNQSDPQQIYLKDGEQIFMQRYKENKELKNLYSILISQILQKKISSARDTVKLILESDYDNGNTHLTNSIINVYLFDKRNARLSLENAKSKLMSQESNNILKTVKGLTYLLEFKFIDAYKAFT